MFAKSKVTKTTDPTTEAQRILAVVRTRAMERRGDDIWRHAKRIIGGESCTREDCALACEAFAKVGIPEAVQVELIGFFMRWQGADSSERAKMLKVAAGHPILAAFAQEHQRMQAEEQARNAREQRERDRVTAMQKHAEAQRVEAERIAKLKFEADTAFYREQNAKKMAGAA